MQPAFMFLAAFSVSLYLSPPIDVDLGSRHFRSHHRACKLFDSKFVLDFVVLTETEHMRRSTRLGRWWTCTRLDRRWADNHWRAGFIRRLGDGDLERSYRTFLILS